MTEAVFIVINRSCLLLFNVCFLAVTSCVNMGVCVKWRHSVWRGSFEGKVEHFSFLYYVLHC